jgi:RNA polymerase sigma factor (sigma-70 family)
MSEIALSIRGVPEPPLAGRLSSDERLARLVARGSERAFAALYERHHQALYRYARSIVRDEEDARDALQSAMARAFASLRSRERDVAVRPWLFRIVHNEAVSILRRRRPGDRPLGEDEPSALDVERTAHERERLATLFADLQTLGVRQRAALVMRELSGLSIAEIAVALSTSPGAAKQTLFEARCALQEIAEGRAMACEAARRSLSERDGRVLRGRKLRAHLRACGDCRAFQAAIGERSAGLRALAPPLPATAAGTILAHLLASGAGGHGGGAAAVASATVAGGAGAGTTVGTTGAVGGVAGTGGIGGPLGAGLGSHLAGSLALKGLALAAVLAAATAGTARFALDGGGHARVTGAHRATTATLPASAPSTGPAVRAGAPGRGAPDVPAGAGAGAGQGASTSGTQAGGPALWIGVGGSSAQKNPASPGASVRSRAQRGAGGHSTPAHGRAHGGRGGRQSAHGRGGRRSTAHRTAPGEGRPAGRRPPGARTPGAAHAPATPAGPTPTSPVKRSEPGEVGQAPSSQRIPSESAGEQAQRERPAAR